MSQTCKKIEWDHYSYSPILTKQGSSTKYFIKLSMYLHFMGHFHQNSAEIIFQAQWKTVFSFVQCFGKAIFETSWNWAVHLSGCMAKFRLFRELINSPFHHGPICCYVKIYNCKSSLWFLLRDCVFAVCLWDWEWDFIEHSPEGLFSDQYVIFKNSLIIHKPIDLSSCW